MAHIYNSQLDAFDLYHQVHDSYYSRPSTSILGGPALPALGHALAGSTGAAISNIATYPWALIVTRLQIQRYIRKRKHIDGSGGYTSIAQALRCIIKKEGLKGLYAGLASDTVKTIADSFLFFLAYNFIRQSRLRYHKKSSPTGLPVSEELGVGFLAGAISKFMTTPIANIVTRKQACSMLDDGPSNGSFQSIAQQIRSEHGLRGFWSGYSASLILTFNPSLTFFFSELIKRTVVPHGQQSKPSSSTTFVLAALSKALASTITYPFSFAKTRMQVSARSIHDEKDMDNKANNIPTSSSAHVGRSGNVYTTILDIIKVEGISCLYEGLGGEVSKGFFSHGITMLTKEMVHRAIIRLYYMILKLSKQYPSVPTLGQTTIARAIGVSNATGSEIKAAARRVKHHFED